MKHLAIRYFCLALLLPAPTAFADASSVEPVKTTVRFETIIAQMEDAIARLRDARYLFHKQEVVDGEQQPIERIAVKYRAPNDIYMKWLGAAHHDQELLFRANWNDGQLRVNPGGWLPTVNLDPEGYLAMRGNRHSIQRLPFPAIVANFAHSAKLIAADPALHAQISDLGEQQHYAERAHCYQLDLPKAQQPKLYATRVKLCISLRTRLPVIIQSWDWEDGALRRVENYGYENVRINVGLSERDFAADNSEYHF